MIRVPAAFCTALNGLQRGTGTRPAATGRNLEAGNWVHQKDREDVQRNQSSSLRVEATDGLIERARHDPQAFGELYDMYLHRVYAFCLSRTADRNEAEDLTAQTFERALGAIGRYQTRGAPLSAWLLRIAANLVADRGRMARTVVLLGDGPIPEDPRAPSTEPDPEDWVVDWERAQWLRSQLATLPADQQEALRLRYWEGYSVADVAQRLSRNENATKQLLHRAMTGMRRRLQGAQSDG